MIRWWHGSADSTMKACCGFRPEIGDLLVVIQQSSFCALPDIGQDYPVVPLRYSGAPDAPGPPMRDDDHVALCHTTMMPLKALRHVPGDYLNQTGSRV
ncbi:hypothetical protein [Paractinoplanes hotanensis]|uniref:Uncharacterized protein n=1 Tax=Paractinoplanes hotanensis TaxID=2906497 RepID=A0ABT0Y0A7_9ACTN|nr:hypothetical protein [Actinoplanes hotanensis]MCM4078902.1 hypothetical protein [Actinoplanes hotanensis]